MQVAGKGGNHWPICLIHGQERRHDFCKREEGIQLDFDQEVTCRLLDQLEHFRGWCGRLILVDRLHVWPHLQHSFGQRNILEPPRVAVDEAELLAARGTGKVFTSYCMTTVLTEYVSR